MRILELNNDEIRQLSDGYTPPALGYSDREDIIFTLANKIKADGSAEKIRNYEQPYLDLDDVRTYLWEIKELIPNSKQQEFEDIEDRLLTNLENQRDYFIDNYDNLKKDC